MPTRCDCRAAKTARGSAGALRVTLKAAIQFGLPPERFWPYEAAALERVPDPYLYSFNTEYRDIRYIRVDGVMQSGGRRWSESSRYWQPASLVRLGFGVPSSLTNDPEIPFPTRFDSIRTGQAVTAVGYNDELRIRSARGAALDPKFLGSKMGSGRLRLASLSLCDRPSGR